MLNKFSNDPTENTFDLQTIVTQHSTGQDIVKCTFTSKCQKQKIIFYTVAESVKHQVYTAINN